MATLRQRLDRIELDVVPEQGIAVVYTSDRATDVYWRPTSRSSGGETYRGCIHGKDGGPPQGAELLTRADVDKLNETHQVIVVRYVDKWHSGSPQLELNETM